MFVWYLPEVYLTSFAPLPTLPLTPPKRNPHSPQPVIEPFLESKHRGSASRLRRVWPVGPFQGTSCRTDREYIPRHGQLDSCSVPLRVTSFSSASALSSLHVLFSPGSCLPLLRASVPSPRWLSQQNFVQRLAFAGKINRVCVGLNLKIQGLDFGMWSSLLLSEHMSKGAVVITCHQGLADFLWAMWRGMPSRTERT